MVILMKIMFNTGCMRKGGSERVISNLANYLVEDNSITIVTTVNEKPYYELNKNIKLYSLDSNSSKNFIVKNIKRITRLNRIIKQDKPDIIVSFLPEPSYRILLLKLFKRKLKVVVSVRNDPKIEYKSKINNLIMRLLYPLANGFVFQTEDAKSYFSQRIQEKSIIIPNPINENFICSPYTGKRDKTIVTVGRLEKQKNHKLLIDAFSDFSKEYNDYKLIIYGDGSLKEELKQQINHLRLQNKVILAGQIDDIKQEIYRAGMFVLTSDYEGMPNALMEAMSLGIPCISTDSSGGGARTLIKNKFNGLLVPINNKKHLVNAMKTIASSKKVAEKLARNARNSMNKYNQKEISSQWYKYIQFIQKK